MGVRGLTTYIAQNAKQFLKPYELHDCDVVIDGDNLSSQIYKWLSHCNSAFGGDYDQYYRTVVHVFKLFEKCNVTPYVLLDGGYEQKKLKVVKQRLRSKIASIKYIRPTSNTSTFPLMMREVFVDALRDCGVSLMRCFFEADDEIALLAKKLNCPVLSYDSDFYIHNVMYIPSSTVTFKVYKRSLGLKPEDGKKRGHCRKVEMKEDEVKTEENGFYYFLDCCLYQIENLATAGGVKLKEEMLPLFATLIGNDYIERKVLQKFHSTVRLKKTKKKVSLQQKRILKTIQWLRHETMETAISKILSRIRVNSRERVLEQIQDAMSGYNTEECSAFDYFGFETDEKENVKLNIDIENLVESGNEEEVVAEESDEESEKEEVEEDQEIEVKSEEEEDEEDQEIEVESEEEEEEEEEVEVYEFPEWFVPRFMAAEFPRWFVDLLCLKVYINSPQVENFAFPDSNTISFNIFQYILTLVNSPEKSEIVYFTRDLNGHNVLQKNFETLNLDLKNYDPESKKNTKIFREIFKDFNELDAIFKTVAYLPERLRLYFLCIIYWIRNSKHVNFIHVHSVLTSLIALSVVDVKCGAIRETKDFEKSFRKVFKSLEENKKNFDKSDYSKSEEIVFDNKIFRDSLKSIPRNECIIVQEKFIEYYPVSSKLKRKHTEYSTSIIHGFAELQSVIFNLNSLNSLLNYPYQSVKMADCYNGLFMYNIYENLKSRKDVMSYLKNHLFEYAPNLFNYYNLLFSWLVVFNPELEKKSAKKVSKVKAAATAKKNKEEMVKKVLGNVPDCVVVSENDELFEDVNNKFASLLKI